MHAQAFQIYPATPGSGESIVDRPTIGNRQRRKDRGTIQLAVRSADQQPEL